MIFHKSIPLLSGMLYFMSITLLGTKPTKSPVRGYRNLVEIW